MYVGKNKKSDKIEQIESSTKLKIRQNWKLDELENWMKLKIGWDWNLGEIEKEIKFDNFEKRTKMDKNGNRIKLKIR